MEYLKAKSMKILAAVYNPIQFDGRVQRESLAESEFAEVTIVCPAAKQELPDLPGIKIRATSLPKQKIFSHLKFWLHVCLSALRVKPDIIHAHDFFMALPGLVAARLTGSKLVYDAHELFIPEPDVSMSRRDRFWYRLERKAILSARLVIAANEERAKIMVEHYGLAQTPLAIRNIPPEPISALSDAEVFALYPGLKKQSADERLLVYQGDIDLSRGLKDYIEAMENLPQNYRLILIGGGPDLREIEQLAASPKYSKKITVIGKVPKAHLHDMLRQCDVGIITYPNKGLNNLYCAPNKLFEYAQAGLCVACTDNPTLGSVLQKHSFGLTSRPDGIADAINKVFENQAIFAKAIPLFLLENTWPAEAEKLHSAIAKKLRTK